MSLKEDLQSTPRPKDPPAAEAVDATPVAVDPDLPAKQARRSVERIIDLFDKSLIDAGELRKLLTGGNVTVKALREALVDRVVALHTYSTNKAKEAAK